MSAKALQVVSPGNLSVQDCQVLDNCIEVFLDKQKEESLHTSQLAFDCVNGILDKQGDSKACARQLYQQVLEDTGVQGKITNDVKNEHYFYQQLLNKLAEKNMLSFDLITAINNRLNSSLIIVDAEFNKIHDGLGKFLKQNRNELARMEARLQNVERNLTLLNWQNAIEYQDFNGEEYTDLGNAAKIVCLVRDFYDITKGNWSTSDLLLLKTAMSTIDIMPKDRLNYFQALAAIASDTALIEKLLGGKVLRPINNPAYLIPMSGLKKLDDLQHKEKYIVESVKELLNENKVEKSDETISHSLAVKYLASEAFVDTDNDVEAYDLMLDLLYNLRQVELEGILVTADMVNVPAVPVVMTVPQLPAKQELELDVEVCSDNVDELMELAAELRGNNELEKLVDLYQQMADADIVEGYVGLGKCYYYGEGIEQSYARAKKNFEKAKDMENGEAWYFLGIMLDEGKSFAIDPEEAFKNIQKSTELGYRYANYKLGRMYEDGRGTEENLIEAKKSYEEAMKYDIAPAYVARGDMEYGGFTRVWSNYAYRTLKTKAESRGYTKDPDYRIALQYYEKAEQLGNKERCFLIGYMYENGQGTETDYYKALHYYKLSGENGESKALYNIAQMYYCGRGVSQDMVVTGEYLLEAAKLGNRDAINLLKSCYKDFRLSEKDIAEFK